MSGWEHNQQGQGNGFAGSGGGGGGVPNTNTPIAPVNNMIAPHQVQSQGQQGIYQGMNPHHNNQQWYQVHAFGPNIYPQYQLPQQHVVAVASNNPPLPPPLPPEQPPPLPPPPPPPPPPVLKNGSPGRQPRSKLFQRSSQSQQQIQPTTQQSPKLLQSPKRNQLPPPQHKSKLFKRSLQLQHQPEPKSETHPQSHKHREHKWEAALESKPPPSALSPTRFPKKLTLSSPEKQKSCTSNVAGSNIARGTSKPGKQYIDQTTTKNLSSSLGTSSRTGSSPPSTFQSQDEALKVLKQRRRARALEKWKGEKLLHTQTGEGGEKTTSKNEVCTSNSISQEQVSDLDMDHDRNEVCQKNNLAIVSKIASKNGRQRGYDVNTAVEGEISSTSSQNMNVTVGGGNSASEEREVENDALSTLPASNNDEGYKSSSKNEDPGKKNGTLDESESISNVQANGRPPQDNFESTVAKSSPTVPVGVEATKKEKQKESEGEEHQGVKDRVKPQSKEDSSSHWTDSPLTLPETELLPEGQPPATAHKCLRKKTTREPTAKSPASPSQDKALASGTDATKESVSAASDAKTALIACSICKMALFHSVEEANEHERICSGPRYPKRSNRSSSLRTESAITSEVRANSKSKENRPKKKRKKDSSSSPTKSRSKSNKNKGKESDTSAPSEAMHDIMKPTVLTRSRSSPEKVSIQILLRSEETQAASTSLSSDVALPPTVLARANSAKNDAPKDIESQQEAAAEGLQSLKECLVSETHSSSQRKRKRRSRRREEMITESTTGVSTANGINGPSSQSMDSKLSSTSITSKPTPASLSYNDDKGYRNSLVLPRPAGGTKGEEALPMMDLWRKERRKKKKRGGKTTRLFLSNGATTNGNEIADTSAAGSRRKIKKVHQLFRHKLFLPNSASCASVTTDLDAGNCERNSRGCDAQQQQQQQQQQEEKQQKRGGRSKRTQEELIEPAANYEGISIWDHSWSDEESSDEEVNTNDIHHMQIESKILPYSGKLFWDQPAGVGVDIGPNNNDSVAQDGNESSVGALSRIHSLRERIEKADELVQLKAPLCIEYKETRWIDETTTDNNRAGTLVPTSKPIAQEATKGNQDQHQRSFYSVPPARSKPYTSSNSAQEFLTALHSAAMQASSISSSSLNNTTNTTSSSASSVVMEFLSIIKESRDNPQSSPFILMKKVWKLIISSVVPRTAKKEEECYNSYAELVNELAAKFDAFLPEGYSMISSNLLILEGLRRGSNDDEESQSSLRSADQESQQQLVVESCARTDREFRGLGMSKMD